MLDRVQYAFLKVVLRCMSSTPISILLSDAGEATLSLRKLFLANRFILRYFRWSGRPLVERLMFLATNSSDKRFRIQPERCDLIIAFNTMFSFIRALNTTVRPAYFDEDWANLVTHLDIDLESCLPFRVTTSPTTLFKEFAGTRYPGATLVRMLEEK